MSTAELKKKLHHYIDTGQEKKLKAIYLMVEEEIEETYNHWDDKAFMAELQKREASYLNGTKKSYTLAQSVARAKQAIKKK